MDEQFKVKMKEGIAGFRLPSFHEIPDVGLFLEQTTKYIAGVIEPLIGVSITSSMISNYVKRKLIESPQKKQYSREQIAYLIFIAITKSVLSLENLQTMITMQKASYSVERAYEYFCRELENILFYTFGLKENYETVGIENSYQKTILRNAIIAVVHKVYLEKCLSLMQEENKTK
ncbi:MAG: DUF1836 domain-containing protein [Clostridiales bacterium]|nr:DUF1836 domain-containing protein [Clostridiales bacterium]